MVLGRGGSVNGRHVVWFWGEVDLFMVGMYCSPYECALAPVVCPGGSTFSPPSNLKRG